MDRLVQSNFLLLEISGLLCYVDGLAEIFLCITFSQWNPRGKIKWLPFPNDCHV